MGPGSFHFFHKWCCISGARIEEGEGPFKYVLFCLRLKRNKNESGEDALLKMYSPLIERAGANARHAEESTSNLSL